MPNREPIETTNLDTIYGSETIPWSRPRDLLAVGAFGGPGTPSFLGTVRPDGRPHAAGIGAAWHDGDLYFQCGPNTVHTAFGVATAEPHGATRWRF